MGNRLSVLIHMFGKALKWKKKKINLHIAESEDDRASTQNNK